MDSIITKPLFVDLNSPLTIIEPGQLAKAVA